MEKQIQLIKKAECALWLMRAAKLKLECAEKFYQIESEGHPMRNFLFCTKEKAQQKIETGKAVCKRIANYYNNLTREIHLYQLIENKNY